MYLFYIFSATGPSSLWLPEGDFFKTKGPQKEVEGIEHDDDGDGDDDDYVDDAVIDDDDADDDVNPHQVSFVGEPGLDMGGLTKEWFQVPQKFPLACYVAFVIYSIICQLYS